MISADLMSPAELAALLHFHAEAGVEWMLEDSAIDRIAEFAAARASSANPAARATQHPAASREAPRADTPSPAAASRVPAKADDRFASLPASAAPRPAIPDEQAMAEARTIAAGAENLDALRSAMADFQHCNLKNSARNLVFAEGQPSARVMVIGPSPNADDDRDGVPFSGRQGQMLDRMMAAIGLARDDLMLTNVIPWRPPGNRVPSARETEMCRPFIERQIALANPDILLILGNFAARFFFGGTDTIHELRGTWRDIEIAGRRIPALATLHPQDLVSAPAGKRLAWQDLLAFRARLQG